MDKFHVASVTLKIVAIYVIIVLLTNISTVAWTLNTDAFHSTTGISLIHHRILILAPFVLLLLIAGALFAFNRSLSWFLIESDDTESPETDETIYPNQVVAFSVVGLLVAAISLPEFLSSLLSILLAASRIRGTLFLERWPTLLAEFLQVFVGIILFLGARQISELWGRLASATRPLGPGDAPDE